MLPNLLRRIAILARILVEITLRLNRMLQVPRIPLRAGVMPLEMHPLRLDLGGEHVAHARDDLVRGVRVARGARHVFRVVGGHGEIGRGDPLVVELVVLGALVGAGDGGDGVLQPRVVGHSGARGRHVGEFAAGVGVGGEDRGHGGLFCLFI